MKITLPLFRLALIFISIITFSVSAQNVNAIQLESKSNKSLNIKFEAPSLAFVEAETPNGLMSIPLLKYDLQAHQMKKILGLVMLVIVLEKDGIHAKSM